MDTAMVGSNEAIFLVYNQKESKQSEKMTAAEISDVHNGALADDVNSLKSFQVFQHVAVADRHTIMIDPVFFHSGEQWIRRHCGRLPLFSSFRLDIIVVCRRSW